MKNLSSTAIAHPNIALIKYWGNKNQSLRIPVNGSISFNLDSLFTKTQVSFTTELTSDILYINGKETAGSGLNRVVSFLNIVRELAGTRTFAKVNSENNFPVGTGIASSASAFAALSLAASSAFGLNLSEKELSCLARHGSGSASRSIPEGFVEWLPGEMDSDSYAVSIAPAHHWDLVDLVAVVTHEHKKVGSTAGHQLADTSPLQKARVEDTKRRLDIVREAIKYRDFQAMADMVELDSNMMHAVMMTSTPALMYWENTSITIMKNVQKWRASGIPVCYTMDAGPNVHVITTKDSSKDIHQKLTLMSGIKQIFKAAVGDKARLIGN
ncbi:MAG: diphosphomevalonate decarboxylase [Anaerolineaceae bacterium]|nr:diphosphomevalonate decarboxylase [Anaerolineaceae bacterium]